MIRKALMVCGMVAVTIAGTYTPVMAGDFPCEGKDDEGRKIGGAGSITFGVTHLDLEPLREVVDSDLKGKGFDFEREPFFTLGAMGYAGDRRNGARIGAGGWLGYRSFFSDEYQGIADSAWQAQTGESTIDSVIQLHVLFAHIGLIAEKSFQITNNMSAFAGGMIGGGTIVAIKEGRAAGTAFSDWESDTSDTVDINKIVGTAAPVWAFDIHGGATYSFTRWLHVGVDGSVLMHYSTSGFGFKYGSFFTASPAVRARIVFGNAV